MGTLTKIEHSIQNAYCKCEFFFATLDPKESEDYAKHQLSSCRNISSISKTNSSSLQQ
jgi:hypothetical protein